MMSWAFVFGLEIIEDQLLVIKNIRVGEFYYATKAAIYLRGNPIKNPHVQYIWITAIERMIVGRIATWSFIMKAGIVA